MIVAAAAMLITALACSSGPGQQPQNTTPAPAPSRTQQTPVTRTPASPSPTARAANGLYRASFQTKKGYTVDVSVKLGTPTVILGDPGKVTAQWKRADVTITATNTTVGGRPLPAYINTKFNEVYAIWAVPEWMRQVLEPSLGMNVGEQAFVGLVAYPQMDNFRNGMRSGSSNVPVVSTSYLVPFDIYGRHYLMSAVQLSGSTQIPESAANRLRALLSTPPDLVVVDLWFAFDQVPLCALPPGRSYYDSKETMAVLDGRTGKQLDFETARTRPGSLCHLDTVQPGDAT